MAKLRNVEELDRLRDGKQRAMQVEASTGTIITIGMGTCGIAAGAKDTFDAIKQELSRLRITARVGITGCIGICVKEPLVDIQQAGGPRITYANVSPEMVPKLIEEQLIRGRPIKEWVVGRLTTE